ncbi:MAG: YlbF family regulator [Spirochaetes bacterium]|nr:YlbF family regulator [Spirochaetota bacterium]
MEERGVDAILEMANRLGLMIRETEVYGEYRRCAEALESDPEASALLARYEEALGEIERKRGAADIVERYELEAARDMSGEIKDSPLIMEYLDAKRDYIRFLEEIQEALVEPDEP